MQDTNADQAEPTPESPATARKRPKPGERRIQILQALAGMLEKPGAERVTTAALAAQLQVSEAALYRHFASKAQMFEGLIDFIEQSVFTLMNQIALREGDGAHKARQMVMVLMQFAEKNPGMTRVLTGAAGDARARAILAGYPDDPDGLVALGTDLFFHAPNDALLRAHRDIPLTDLIDEDRRAGRDLHAQLQFAVVAGGRVHNSPGMLGFSWRDHCHKPAARASPSDNDWMRRMCEWDAWSLASIARASASTVARCSAEVFSRWRRSSSNRWAYTSHV